MTDVGEASRVLSASTIRVKWWVMLTPPAVYRITPFFTRPGP